ncbi:MAG: polysaccharide deacetylase family protein, partial [Candidatus Tectomicrobia bacterium]|nr:polysaccharide deacetylase family protein [Candidatus Tectomicrobia bacterium]
APYDAFSVSVPVFREQMEWLAQRSLAISLDDLDAFLAGQRDLPDGAVLVTVDDGYDDVWSQAAPVLHRLGIPAVAFIPSAEVGGCGQPDEVAAEAAHLSWAEVRALPGYGIEVGSHAREHASLGSMSRSQVRVQADASRRELESHLQTPVLAFAYPFGTRADYNDMTAEVLRESGYRCVFTAQHGAIRAGAARYDLPRVKVEGDESLWMFKLIVRGGLDAWGWIDRALWRVQRNYD